MFLLFLQLQQRHVLFLLQKIRLTTLYNNPILLGLRRSHRFSTGLLDWAPRCCAVGIGQSAIGPRGRRGEEEGKEGGREGGKEGGKVEDLQLLHRLCTCCCCTTVGIAKRKCSNSLIQLYDIYTYRYRCIAPITNKQWTKRLTLLCGAGLQGTDKQPLMHAPRHHTPV